MEKNKTALWGRRLCYAGAGLLIGLAAGVALVDGLYELVIRVIVKIVGAAFG